MPTVQISDVVRHIFKSNGCWHITCMVGTLLIEGPHRDDALCTLVDFIIIDPDKEFMREEHIGLGEWHHRWKAAAFNANDGTATCPQERFCGTTFTLGSDYLCAADGAIPSVGMLTDSASISTTPGGL